MLKGNQKKLDKNKDGKISGEDFKLLRKKPGGAIAGALALGALGALGASKLMKKNKISSLVSPVKMLDDQTKNSKTQKKTDQQKASKGKMMYASMGMEAKSTKGYGAARTSGMGLQDEQLVPGKSLDYYKDLM